MLGLSKDILCPIRQEGYLFILLFVIGTLLLFLFSPFLGFGGVILTALCVYFFRDPLRFSPQDKGLVVAPADGRILFVKEQSLPAEFSTDGESRMCVAIFMNVFDVHVNRAPAAGNLTHIIYKPGQFFNASLDKANPHNEQMIYALKMEDDREIYFIQIAGLIARRILCFQQEGDTVKTGQRIGMIRFGSRVDVYLPKDYDPIVTKGQRTLAGETVLAQAKGKHLSAKTVFEKQ